MQLTLDFSRTQPITTGKKLSKITFTASAEFEDFLGKIAAGVGRTRSELCHKYVLEGMQRDLGNLFMAEPHLSKSLAEIVSKKF